MKRTEINVGDRLFYSENNTLTWHTTAYEAVVESVDPEPIPHRGAATGVRVKLLDHDSTRDLNRDGMGPRWHRCEPGEPGRWWRTAVVHTRHLRGPWQAWRDSQLASRAARQAELSDTAARRADAEQAVNDANALLAVEDGAPEIGLVEINPYGEPQITVSAALLRELIGGWAHAMGDVSAPDYVIPWRVTT